jgi:cellulose synthase (UDP-forming)
MNIPDTSISEPISTTTLPQGKKNADAKVDLPFLVPLMSGTLRGTYAVLTVLWMLSLAGFWTWWLGSGHNVDSFRFTVNCAILFWTTVVPGYFVAVVSRARVPNPAIAVPRGLRVAMVTTKAPSEPFEVVQKTLEAMLVQTYPHDTWLADEDPSAQTIAWCERHSVRISTRKGVADYHKPSWPRRTKCKEGNLAYFYDHYGYENYDFVSQLDADHVPNATYLEEMLRPFADKQVGYVCAPSICDSNAASSWSARGRLYIEGPFHGSLQAGYNGGLAPTCIGSHYTVRTAALQEIGGLGPELAEDHSTTLIMNANGWRGVHALDAIAHGDGPRTFADLATQEFQWSKSLVIILLRYTRNYFAKLPLHLKGQFLFCQLWYPLCSLAMAGALLLPVLALWAHRVWADVDYLAYVLFSSMLMSSMFAVMACVKRTGSFRPGNAKLLSWEGVVFLFARWPWVLLGTLSAVADCMRGREFGFRVTAKGDVADTQVPLHVVLPYLAIALFCGLPLLAVDDAGNAGGFYLIAILTSTAYYLIASVIVVVHSRERGQRRPIIHILFADKSIARNALFFLAFAVIMSGTYLRFKPGVQAILWQRTMVPGKFSEAQPIKPPALGVYDPEHKFAANDNMAIEHIFVDWSNPDTTAYIRQSYEDARRSNRWLMITVEPWTAKERLPERLLSDIGNGHYDMEIQTVCKTMAALDAPIFVRWGHEMEIPRGRYPWANNDPANYIRAYRRFVDGCRIQSSKFLYVWSPAGDSSLHAYFPGEHYTDFVGLSIYECPRCGVRPASGNPSAAEILKEEYQRVQRYRLPVMIAELGIDGDPDHRQAELQRLQETLMQYPLLKAVLYFNAKDTPGAWPVPYVPDWRIEPQFFPSSRTQ